MPHLSHNRLKTLNSVVGFGLFRNFTWDATQLDHFGRYNLVYGWNYSGKTTLSRVFQCLEDGSLHADFAGGTFQFTKGDGTTVGSTFVGPRPHLRVFNRHFVQRNFHQGSDMTGAHVIAVLGEANQALKNRLADLESRSSRLDAFANTLNSRKATIQQQMDDDRTAQARVVNGIIGGRYDRRHLNDSINALPSDHWPLPLNENTLKEKIEQYRRATDFSEVPRLFPDHSRIVRLVFTLRDALREVATNTAISVLQNNQPLEVWVQTGLGLNAAGAPCGFCGAPVAESRWSELQGHFSEAFARLQNRLREYHSALSELDFDAPTLTESSLFPDLRARFQAALGTLRTSLENAALAVAHVTSVLEAKLARLETPVQWQPNISAAKELRSSIQAYNAVLIEHNTRVATAETVKAEARQTICEHYAVCYLRDCKTIEKEVVVAQLQWRVSDSVTTRDRIGAQIAAVKQAIKDASIAARRINDNLEILLPGDNIEAIKLNDTDFQFQRAGQIATNMSEGERTAVAFSYFLTTLDEGTTPLEETIIVLDDPVSSLDSNHIYSVHSITENRLARARQLFVLTHNSSFFGITKDWIKKLDGRFYMTQRTLNANREWHASLVRLPRLLKKFKSDYQYTYYCLTQIDADPAPQFEHLCGVPNMVRRLLEAYLGFVFPESGGWGDKLQKLIPNEEICGKIKKFADDNSHSHSLTQATEVPDYVAHCKEVIHDVLDALKNHNPTHVSSLEAEFTAEVGNLP
jgi:wobble nucleotide-excising tRNase